MFKADSRSYATGTQASHSIGEMLCISDKGEVNHMQCLFRLSKHFIQVDVQALRVEEAAGMRRYVLTQGVEGICGIRTQI